MGGGRGRLKCKKQKGVQSKQHVRVCVCGRPVHYLDLSSTLEMSQIWGHRLGTVFPTTVLYTPWVMFSVGIEDRRRLKYTSVHMVELYSPKECAETYHDNPSASPCSCSLSTITTEGRRPIASTSTPQNKLHTSNRSALQVHTRYTLEPATQHPRSASTIVVAP